MTLYATPPPTATPKPPHGRLTAHARPTLRPIPPGGPSASRAAALTADPPQVPQPRHVARLHAHRLRELGQACHIHMHTHGLG